MRVIDHVHALLEADNQNPALYFFDRLGNPIQGGNKTYNDIENSDGAGGLAGVDKNNNSNGEEDIAIHTEKR